MIALAIAFNQLSFDRNNCSKMWCLLKMDKHTMTEITRAGFNQFSCKQKYLQQKWDVFWQENSNMYVKSHLEIHRSMHHQKSSSVSPLQPNTGIPFSANAAATSFWVL